MHAPHSTGMNFCGRRDVYTPKSVPCQVGDAIQCNVFEYVELCRCFYYTAVKRCLDCSHIFCISLRHTPVMLAGGHLVIAHTSILSNNRFEEQYADCISFSSSDPPLLPSLFDGVGFGGGGVLLHCTFNWYLRKEVRGRSRTVWMKRQPHG